jgi:glycolate oxidase FAD binding subunit
LLLAKFDGARSAVFFQLSESTKILEQFGLTVRRVADEKKIWQSLTTLPFKSSGNLTWRASVRTAELETFLVELDRIIGVNNIWNAGAGDGRVRVVQELPQTDNGREEFFKTTADEIKTLRAAAERLGGSVVIEAAPDELKKLVSVWGNSGSASEIMQRVKDQLNPDNILSPGRFEFNQQLERSHHA